MHTFIFELVRKSGNASLKKGNQMISSNDRMHHIVKAQIVSYLRELAKEKTENQIKTQYTPDHPCQVTIKVFPPTNRRMDAPNWYPTVKALLDGMTDAGVWSDDDNRVIRKTSFEHGGLSGTKNYKLEINIEELGE